MENLLDPEELIGCPYNIAHQVRRKVMSGHLVKCRRSYTDLNYVQCVFNVTHQLPELEMQYHQSICPDRKAIESKISKGPSKADERFPMGQNETNAAENWDNLNVPAYDPQDCVVKKDVMRSLNVESEAKRRDFRMNERQRLAQLDHGQKGDEAPPQRQTLPQTRPIGQGTNHPLPSSISSIKEKIQSGKRTVFNSYQPN